MPSLYDFDFSGDDPSPDTDPVPDSPTGEEVVGEDDRANYREPGVGESFEGGDPSVFRAEGDPDEPGLQSQVDSPPIETEQQSSVQAQRRSVADNDNKQSDDAPLDIDAGDRELDRPDPAQILPADIEMANRNAQAIVGELETVSFYFDFRPSELAKSLIYPPSDSLLAIVADALNVLRNGAYNPGMYLVNAVEPDEIPSTPPGVLDPPSLIDVIADIPTLTLPDDAIIQAELFDVLEPSGELDLADPFGLADLNSTLDEMSLLEEMIFMAEMMGTEDVG